MRLDDRIVPGLCLALAIAAHATGQDPGAQGSYTPFYDVKLRDDVVEWVQMGGQELEFGDVVVRAKNAILVFDRAEAATEVIRGRTASGLPRRSIAPPPSRRELTEGILRERLRSFLSAARRAPTDVEMPADARLRLLRSFYLEGDVVVVQGGLEVARADQLFFSVLDDRAVFRNATLRLESTDSAGRQQLVVVRSDELVRAGKRITGRDVSVTTCAAGEPHFDVISGEIEILEHEREFEIRARDNSLRFSGTRVLPLPSTTYFTSEQSQFLVKGAAASYSEQEKLDVRLELGSDFNDIGGAVHELLTGRPADEFRGDWVLGLGYIQTRGAPLELDLDYAADDLYFGNTIGFYMEDEGPNIREIRNNLDGTKIDNKTRRLVQSENRIELGENTTLDLTAFDAGDAAVYSEFFSARYYSHELPETSVILRHADRNYIGVGVYRANMAAFSYGSGRELVPAFSEQLPNLTFDWFSEPILELPGDAPLLLTTSTGVAKFRSNFDDTVVATFDDETGRAYQEVELAAPYLVGGIGIRPFFSGGFTYYDNTVAGSTFDRWSFTTGVELGTRLSKVWKSTEAAADDEAGDGAEVERSVRHVISPTIRFEDRFRVDGQPSDFWQFDPIDALDERTDITVGLLQRLQHKLAKSGAVRDVYDYIWFYLAQHFRPHPDRANNEGHLGLLEYEFLFRPDADWLGLPDVQLMTEGQYDWDIHEFRTFNNYLQARLFDLSLFGQYRTDKTEKGQVGYGASLPIRGRWTLAARSLYDLDDGSTINYVARLMRADHDWRIILSLTYNNVTDDTSLNIEFEPSFGGLFRKRVRPFAGSADYGGGNYTRYY